MKTDRAAVGRRGEEEASRYLTRLGHRILARNWRGGHLELDIVTLAGTAAPGRRRAGFPARREP